MGLAIDGLAVVGAVYAAARGTIYAGAASIGVRRDLECVDVTSVADPVTESDDVSQGAG